MRKSWDWNRKGVGQGELGQRERQEKCREIVIDIKGKWQAKRWVCREEERKSERKRELLLNEERDGEKLWKAMQTRGSGNTLSYRLTFNIQDYLKSLNKMARVMTRGCILPTHNSWHGSHTHLQSEDKLWLHSCSSIWSMSVFLISQFQHWCWCDKPQQRWISSSPEFLCVVFLSH